MKIIVSGRGTGKTTTLIQQSAKEGHYIICHSTREASRICSVAKRMRLHIPMPITYGEFLNRRYYGRGITGFLIDDLDMLLAELSPVLVYTFTITQEEADG